MKHFALYLLLSLSFASLGQQLADNYEVSRSVGYEQNDFHDVNGDGILDMVTLGSQDFAYYLGNGDGTFGMKQLVRDTLSIGVVQTLNFDYADFNNDGSVDFVVAAGISEGVEVFMNTGSGFNQVALQNVDPYLKSVFCQDMTGDGLEDVITGHRDVSGGNQQWMQIFVNLGGGNFASGVTLVNNVTVDDIFYLQDMDNDGDEDVVKRFVGTSTSITIIQNTGTSFTQGPHYTVTGKTFTEFDFLDVDNDGYQDIVIPFYNTLTSIRWWKNMGNAVNLTGYDITVPTRANSVDITTTDIDQDNNVDVVMTTANIVYWYENTLGSFQLIDTLATWQYYPFKHIDVDDLDGDLVPDLSVVDDYGSSVFLNDGFTQFPSENRVTQMPKDPMFVDIKDIDNDGIKDIIYSTGFGSSFIKDIVWHKSDGNNLYDEETVILRHFLDIYGYEVEDVDGDGDNDLVLGCASCSINSTSYTNRLLVMWNDGSGNFSNPDNLGSIRARYMQVVDIDGDLDNDIVAVSSSISGFYTVKIFWNNGAGFTEQQIYYGTKNKQDVFVADMNGDNYKDLVIKSTVGISTPGFEIWYNNGANGFPSGTPNGSRNFQINVQDFDNDGDYDVMKSYTFGSNYEGIMLLKNNGAGQFTDSVDLEYFVPSIGNSKFLYPYDFDDDLDLDLFALESDSITYFENLGGGNWANKVIIQTGPWLVSDLALGNIDGDPMKEIVTASEGHDQVMASTFVNVANPPTLVISNDTVCVGATIQIDVTNYTELNQNTTWALYEGTIGSTPDQVSTTGIFTVTVDSTTNFYISGYGGVNLNGPTGIASVFVYQSTWEDTVAACGSYTWAGNGTTYSASGDYSVTYTSIQGCDSILNLHLTINTPTTGTTSATACVDYFWPASGATYTTSGNYDATLTAANGCDSVVTLALTINQPSVGDTTAVECSAYTWYGNTYTSSGNYTSVLTNAAGCDSTVTLNLTVNQPTSDIQQITNCSSYTWPLDGNTYTQSGQYTHVLPNAAGCDSTVTLDLTINVPTVGTDVVSACDSYTWIDGNNYTASTTTPTWTLTNAAGCDSTVTLDLTINASTSSTIIDTALDVYTLNGLNYTVSGSYTQIIPNANGCDSTINLELTIYYTGIEENELKDLVMFPNPSTGSLIISWDTDALTVREIEVMDSKGRRVQALDPEIPDYDLYSLSSAVYYIKITTSKGTLFKKWVKE